MKYSWFALTIAIACGTGAIAQDTNSFDGKWIAKVKSSNGKNLDAEVAVKGDSGTWQYNFDNLRKVNQCLTSQLVIAVSRKTADELEFVIKHAAIDGCTDIAVKLRRADDKSLVGKIGVLDVSLFRP